MLSDVGLKFGPNSYEGLGGTMMEEMVFILVRCIAEFTASKELHLGGSQIGGIGAVRADPHLIP